MINPGPILFLCEGTPETGFGHVGRCLALAEAFRGGYGKKCIFGFRGIESIAGKINSAGFSTLEITDFNSYEFSNECAVILDLRIPLSNNFFERAERAKKLLCTIDDPTPNRLRCDLAFYPPVPQFEELDWNGFQGQIFKGWEYIPLRKEFSVPGGQEENHSIPRILITMGGSDPHGFTQRILTALRSVKTPWETDVVIGPMFNNLDKIKEIAVEHGSKVNLLYDIKDMAELMRRCNAAVASFGMTAYELAACATPQVLLSLTEDHACSASALHESGAAVSLGKYDRVNEQKLVKSLQDIISDRQQRTKMSQKAASLKIGKGASNIASVIMQKNGA